MTMTNETTGMSSSSACTNNNNNGWRQLQVWQQAWCQKTPAALPNDCPLQATRGWIQRHAPLDKKTLDRLLKWLLTLPLPSEKELMLRHIEWQVVVLLELRMKLAPTLLLKRFTKCHERTKTTQQQRVSKRKRQRAEDALLPERRFHDFLIQQLTRAVFCLPANQPLVTFLTQQCLTRTMWQKLPQVVIEILDFFEIENPYLPSKRDKIEEDLIRPKLKQSKPQPQSAATIPPPRRPLLTVSKFNKNRGRLNHFHGMLQDVTKLLDESQPTMTTGSSSTKKRPIITPQTTNSYQRKKIDIKSRTNLAITARPQLHHDVGNKPPPKHLHNVPDDSIASSPIPSRKASVVAETPVQWTESGLATETPSEIHESPPARNPLSDSNKNDDPCDRLVPEPSTIKPIKLFAAISKKPNPFLPKTNSNSIVPPPPPVVIEQQRPKRRSTSSAVEAARSFLRRKSL